MHSNELRKVKNRRKSQLGEFQSEEENEIKKKPKEKPFSLSLHQLKDP